MTTTLTAKWSYPTTVWAGPDRIRELPQACRALKISRPLLVTDRGLRDSAMVSRAVALCNEAKLPTMVFADAKGNPVSANVDVGLGVYRDHQADGVIALGGGSAIDVGKAVAFMIGQGRPIWDFEDVGDWWMRANPQGIAPIVAIPTTAGTGSEVGRAAVITNEVTREKKIIFHPQMQPSIVISDPLLTIGLPPAITAATGFDAFVHCFEAYCAPGFHPLADGMALEGMHLISKYLPRAYHKGDDVEARAYMLAAASMGAAAFQKGLGAVHSLAHAVGALYDTHHGLTNAVILPYVMQYNREAIFERMIVLARLLSIPGASFDGILQWVVAFRRDLGIPNTLNELGVPADRAEEIGALAARDPSTAGNPRPIDAAAFAAIFRNAVSGSVKG
jgi:alcohol dehydrogenase class IV